MAMVVPAVFKQKGAKLTEENQQLCHSCLLYTSLAVGMIVAFVVSILTIKFLMGYIKKHDFKAFGWYRIVLGAAVILYLSLIHIYRRTI